MNRLHLEVVGSLLVVACSTAEPELPAIPEPVLDGLSAAVTRQLTGARDAALASPADPLRAGRYGMLLQAYQQDEAASDMYLRATTLAPGEFRWAYYRAYMLESLGEPEASIAAYRAALAINPGYPPAALRLANGLLSQGEHESARQSFASILEQNPESTPARVGLGQTLLASGDDSGAREVFEQVLARQESNAIAHYGLAQIMRTLGDTEAAAEHLRLFEQYRTMQPLSRDLLLSEIGGLNQSDQPSMQRARHSLSRGDVAGAIEHYEEAIRRNPGNTGARVTLVGLYSAINDFANAEKHYNGALPLVPEDVKLHFNYAFSQQRRGKHNAAIEIFGRALALNPDDADSLAYLGVSQLAIGERDAAVESLQRAVATNPQQREGNARLGHVLLENGDADQAVPYLEKATRRDDRYSITYLIVLADAWKQLGDAEAAAKARRRALGLARQFGDERADALADAEG